MRVVPVRAPFALPPVHGVGLAKGRQPAPWDAEVRKLFTLFDLRGDGVIQADEFCRAQLQVAEALGETIHVDGVPADILPGNAAWHARGSIPPPPPPLSRSKTLTALQGAGFHDVDLDGDGMISYEEFRRWQLVLIGSSTSSRATKKRHLAALISDLERQRKGSDPSEAWTAAEARVIAAEGLQELEAAVEAATALGLDVPAPRLALLEQLRTEERERAQAAHLTRLTAAASTGALASALEAAATAFDAGELEAFEQRLEELRRPFSVSVTSLSGAACAVEVMREQTVASLCQEVGARMGKKAYRIVLAHVGGRLAPPTATLEECGVVGPGVEIAASFGAIDPLKELSLVEFLDAVVEHGLGTRSDVEELLKKHESEELSEDTIRDRFQARLAQALEAVERRRREAEEARRREAERKAAVRAERRAPFEALAPAELAARAVAAGLAEHTGEAPEDPTLTEERREGLVERLSLLTAVEASQAEAAGLEAAVRELEPEAQRLAGVAQRIKDEAMLILDQALPALEAAVKAVRGLRLADLVETRSVTKPPALVVRVLEAMCRVFQIRPVRDASGEGRRPADNWYRTAQRDLLGDRNLISRLMHFDKDAIPEDVARSLQAFAEDKACSPEAISMCSVTCSRFAAWLRGMHAYHLVSQEAQPFRLRLAAAEAELSGRLRELEGLRERWRERAGAAAGFQDELQLLLDPP